MKDSGLGGSRCKDLAVSGLTRGTGPTHGGMDLGLGVIGVKSKKLGVYAYLPA